MKYFVFLVTIIALAVGGYVVTSKKTEEPFIISGKVEVAERLMKIATAENVSCAVIAKNEADVPIAVKRVINAKFPMDFSIDKNDLLIESFTGNIKLEVQINNHGNLGVLKAGDVFGAADGLYAAGRRDIVVVADKMIGKPTLSAKNSRGNGNFFRTAAR